MSSSISSSNYYNVSSTSSNNGISGLMSGMDTESMVKKMLSATQSKIDKQNQLKTTTEWKQTIYQGVVSDINTFKGKYFDSTYGSTLATNLASSSFFNSMVSSVTSGSSVKVVSSSSSASTGDMSVVVSQLASAANISSSSKMSGTQTITGSAMDVAAIKSTIDSGKELAVTLSLDGTAKTLTFSKADFSGTVDADSIKSALDAEITKAFGSYVSASMTSDNKLTLSLNLKDTNGNIEDGHELTVTGADAKSFGITPGASTLISGSTKLGDLSGIQGDAYSFTINGTSFTFSSADTVSGMMNKINTSDAGVKISYSSMNDKFTMQTASTGAQYGIAMSQQTGNLLSAIFGSSAVSAASKANSDVTLQAAAVSCTGLDGAYTTTGASMKMTVNGTDYTFTLANKETDYTKSEVESALNTWLTETFGQTDSTSNISYADGKLTTAEGYAVSFSKTTVDTSDSTAVAAAAKTDLALAFGFSTSGASNAVTGDTNIADVLQLQGLSFLESDGTTAATKLSDIASYLYNGTSYSVSYSEGDLYISGTSTLNLSGTGLETLFGSTVELGTGTTATGAVKAGTDALAEIDGVSTSRSSNTFTVGGITMTATKVSSEKTVIGTTRDTDSIVSAVKSFVTDYNTMVSKLYSLITEDPDYRDYAPLTSAQKEDMSDSEITAWETKAKTGLVRSDSDISSFLSSLRTAMDTTCKNAGIALYSIGVETSAWDLTGQLLVDESALKSAIASDPEAVATLFTDSADGLAKQISTICDKTAKLSVASPGSLVSLAGAKGWSVNAKTNDLYLQLSTISDKLDDLQDKYDDEKDRYWAKFTAMETAMAS
ncbi:MAG: flagellar filament capping protein FliD [Oscillospiraceae bacterium]